MLWIYRLLFLPVLLVLAPRYLLRMRQRGGYRANFGHRFGGHAPRRHASGPPPVRIWLQAVSVGEMLAIGPLLDALREDGAEVYLTTTTSTGYRLAMERFRDRTVGVGYFPIDWWLFSARAWKRIQPDLVILTEGERWPEHLHQAARRGVPVWNVNARISDRSFARLRRLGAVRRLMFGGITRFLAVSPEDAARFVAFGVPAARVVATGNLKLDVQIARLDERQRAQWRAELGLTEPLWLLGSSTWPGEEEALLHAWRDSRAAGFKCSLLLVPRHAERRGEIERLLIKAEVRYHFRSRGPAPGEVEVAVADTTGELRQLTQLADLVFVGKSLPPHLEGQTPVEAAALGKPILLGPGMSNFRDIARDLQARGAAREVRDAAELRQAVLELWRDPERRTALARAAAGWQAENSGALQRTHALVREELKNIREQRSRVARAPRRVL